MHCLLYIFFIIVFQHQLEKKFILACLSGTKAILYENAYSEPIEGKRLSGQFRRDAAPQAYASPAGAGPRAE